MANVPRPRLTDTLGEWFEIPSTGVAIIDGVRVHARRGLEPALNTGAGILCFVVERYIERPR